VARIEIPVRPRLDGATVQEPDDAYKAEAHIGVEELALADCVLTARRLADWPSRSRCRRQRCSSSTSYQAMTSTRITERSRAGDQHACASGALQLCWVQILDRGDYASPVTTRGTRAGTYTGGV
jgi:hypothetical protein